MKISNQTKIAYSPIFTSYHKKITYDSLGPIAVNNTRWFRKDLLWDKFIAKLGDKYNKTDKVNIYCYACSDGAEPFSLAMFLIKKFGEKGAKKFFPIIASDIDSKILQRPQQGRIKLSQKDLRDIKEKLGPDYLKFIQHNNNFQLIPEYNSIEKICDGIVNPTIKNNIIFHNTNVISDINNIKGDNNVIMCRNVWPYLTREDQQNLAKTMFNKLGNNSMCVIGCFDQEQSIANKYLLKQGFLDTGVNYCFEKPSISKQTSNPDFLQANFIPQT